jgi:hypothetical protein|tara:strand:- start:1549 stop:1953 length:405 start_codon:yes stop_codon:yes gene_type:complete
VLQCYTLATQTTKKETKQGDYMFYVTDYKVKTNVTTESFKEVVKRAIDMDVFVSLDQGVMKFTVDYVVNKQLGDKDARYAIWNWMGTLRLIDYSDPNAYSKKSGEWPIITDIMWSKELSNTIYIETTIDSSEEE